MKVATTVHSYFNFLEERVEEGELSYNEVHPPHLLETLKQADLYSVGVTQTMYSGWRHQAKAEKTYNEIVDMTSIGCRRSDITTESSMKLYTSFFDQSTEMSPVSRHKMHPPRPYPILLIPSTFQCSSSKRMSWERGCHQIQASR